MATEAPIVTELGLASSTRPPELIVVYLRNGRRKCRYIPLSKFAADTPISSYALELQQKARWQPFLQQCKLVQLEKHLRIIQDTLKGIPVQQAIADNQALARVGSNEDLTGLDDEVLSIKKKTMDVMFEKNRLKPGDPGFQHDVVVEHRAVENSGWDSSDGEETEPAAPVHSAFCVADEEEVASTEQEDAESGSAPVLAVLTPRDFKDQTAVVSGQSRGVEPASGERISAESPPPDMVDTDEDEFFVDDDEDD